MTEGPQPAVPSLRPPLLEVGFNYPWAFNRYGTQIGPRDIENNPPFGKNSEIAVFRDKGAHPPEGSLARNLDVLKHELKITKVRMFLLGNLVNYGRRPAYDQAGEPHFEPPKALHPLFIDHFAQMLDVFRAKGMQILPSLVDFGAFYPDLGGRASLATHQREHFLRTVAEPMVNVSKHFRETVFAWEAINEPYWNALSTWPLSLRPHTKRPGPDVSDDAMRVFITDLLGVFAAAGFETTVGHRFFADLYESGWPVGTRPQFHYYPKTSSVVTGVVMRTDPRSLPSYESLAKNPKTKDAFVGEFDPGLSHDSPWVDCRGADGSVRTRAFERLKVLARKGYKLAFVWPDVEGELRADHPVLRDDALKLTHDAMESIKQFTTGSFPNGVPE